MKMFKVLFLAMVVMFFAVSAMAAGFDQYGYNTTARVFVGTGTSWCMGKLAWTESACNDYMAPYGNDQLVMKWNKEWDRGNLEKWVSPPYKAEENNEWNGQVDGGSGEVWHYKIVWVGDCGADGTPVPGGGYCIWGQFATIMDQGTGSGIGDKPHVFLERATPAGYGAYYDKAPLP